MLAVLTQISRARGRGSGCLPVDGADVVAALGGEGGDMAADAA
jgi:hypothetical protein